MTGLTGHALDEYEWVEGEVMAGLALGYNFGDGYLHGELLLAAIQARCGFEPGECVCLWVDSFSLCGPSGERVPYFMLDATNALDALSLSTQSSSGAGARQCQQKNMLYMKKGHLTRTQLTNMQPF